MTMGVRAMRAIKGRQSQPEPVETPGAGARPEISERVLAYFSRNSDAMDSVEGIARFWGREDQSVVERALVDLHEKGLLDRRIIGGTAFYSHPREAPGARSNAARKAAPPARGPAGPSSSSVVAPSSRASAREAPGRLLVIDDDASVRKFLVAAL